MCSVQAPTGPLQSVGYRCLRHRLKNQNEQSLILIAILVILIAAHLYGIPEGFWARVDVVSSNSANE